MGERGRESAAVSVCLLGEVESWCGGGVCPGRALALRRDWLLDRDVHHHLLFPFCELNRLVF